MDISTVGDLRAFDVPTLEKLFGRYGLRLYDLARGKDDNPVVPNRPSKSISAEDTVERDITLRETAPIISRLASKVWQASNGNHRLARTAVLKLKTKEFRTLTRSLTPPSPPASEEDFASICLSLRDRVELTANQLFRLIGVGLANFTDVGNDSNRSNLLFGRETTHQTIDS